MKNWPADLATLLLRLAAGAVFVPHGYSKIFSEGGAASFAADMPAFGIPAFLGYIAAYAEFFGGLLLIVGLVTRLWAFLLACTMGVAAFVVQLPDALHEVQPGAIALFVAIRGIETPLALMAVCIALSLMGAGRFSLDAAVELETRLFRKRKAAAEAAAVSMSAES